jgi:hypothetical protein
MDTAQRFEIASECVRELLKENGMIEGDGRQVVRSILMQWSNDIPGLRVVVRPEGEA